MVTTHDSLDPAPALAHAHLAATDPSHWAPFLQEVVRACNGVDFLNDQALHLLRSVPWFQVAVGRVCQVGDLDVSELAAAVWSAPTGVARTWRFGYGDAGAYRCGTLRLIAVAPESSFAACWPHAHALLFIDLPAEPPLADRVEQFAQRHRLTPREHQILALAVGQKQSKQIADELGLSHGTVRVNLSNVYGKAGCRSLAELVRLLMAM